MQAVAPLPHIHGNARIEKITAPEPSLQFATDEARWSYAVSFELDAAKSLRGTGEPRAVFDLEVEDGEIGIGCTTADYTSYLDREVFVPSGMRRKVYVPIGAPGAASHLMLRNVSVRGRSVARVHGLEFRRVTAAEEIQEQLRTSGPIGAAVLHGAAVVQAIGPRVPPPDFQPILIETEAQESSNAVSFGLTMPRELGGTGQRRVVVDLEVEAGAVGIGCTTADYSAYVDREMFVPQGNRRKVYVPVGPLGAAGHLMFRNASLRGGSVARIHSITVNRIGADQEERDNVTYALWDAPLVPPQRVLADGEGDTKLHRALANLRASVGANVNRLTFPIAVAHTSRAWDWERCTQDFLRNRYERPGRLDNLPLFEELPPAQEARSHAGHLSLFDLTIDINGVSLTATRCIDSHEKIQHACRVGDKLVICLEDYIIVLPASADAVKTDNEPSVERIDDPWFAGLHTIFPVDDTHCVISASAPDALLLLDIKQRRVVWRWRVPADRYGRNYQLTDSMSVQDHHIENDIQLAHLNCAYPDGHGGFWVSTLGQGDVGHVLPNGDYELIASGFVGCHGVRYSNELECLYFSDSCTGRLIGISADRVPRTIGAVDSRWLHDAQHLAGDIFLLCLGDKNAIVVLHTSSNCEIARFDMKARGENVQFANLMAAPKVERSHGHGEKTQVDFKSLREKWRELPQIKDRVFSDEFLLLDRSEFIEKWQSYYDDYRKAESRFWYQILYKEFMEGKSVLEIGSGLGFDGVFFLQEGAKQWTFCDIAKTNLDVIRRVCGELGLQADLVFIDDDFACFEKLGMYDVIWANGSLINVPFEFAREECLTILPHLKPGGRWIELCYPQARWIREGKIPFSEWGKVTDGERTPWMEWYDLVKIKNRLFPAPLKVVLDFNFNNDTFNWFDLVFSSDRRFEPNRSFFDLDVFPAGQTPKYHGDTVVVGSADDFLEIVSPEGMWSSALSFDLAASIAEANTAIGRLEEGFSIEVDLLVSQGHVGIIVLGDDVGSPLCQEHMVAAKKEPSTVIIAVPAQDAVRLVFRNTAAGTRSQFKLRRITLRFLTAE